MRLESERHYGESASRISDQAEAFVRMRHLFVADPSRLVERRYPAISLTKSILQPRLSETLNALISARVTDVSLEPVCRPAARSSNEKGEILAESLARILTGIESELGGS